MTVLTTCQLSKGCSSTHSSRPSLKQQCNLGKLPVLADSAPPEPQFCAEQAGVLNVATASKDKLCLYRKRMETVWDFELHQATGLCLVRLQTK